MLEGNKGKGKLCNYSLTSKDFLRIVRVGEDEGHQENMVLTLSTKHDSRGVTEAEMASIEPAWDLHGSVWACSRSSVCMI